MQTEQRYKYYKSSDRATRYTHPKYRSKSTLSQERLNPSLKNPDYLVLRERTRLISKWLEELGHSRLDVIDIGGRIQPYRPLVDKRLKRYIAIDPQMSGLVDVIAVGENLPIKNEIFDLAFCTQTLGYTNDPFKVVAEIHRVLRPGAAVILSAPAFFPKHHDERWRFLPEGFEVLFSCFSRLTIAPDGYSISGLFRTICVCLNIFIENRFIRKLVTLIAIPVFNLCGRVLDRLSKPNVRISANFTALAIK